MFITTNDIKQPNGDDGKSTIGEKISGFLHTKILGMTPEFYEFIRSLGKRQDDDQFSSDDIIVIDETNETD